MFCSQDDIKSWAIISDDHDKIAVYARFWNQSLQIWSGVHSFQMASNLLMGAKTCSTQQLLVHESKMHLLSWIKLEMWHGILKVILQRSNHKCAEKTKLMFVTLELPSSENINKLILNVFYPNNKYHLIPDYTFYWAFHPYFHPAYSVLEMCSCETNYALALVIILRHYMQHCLLDKQYWKLLDNLLWNFNFHIHSYVLRLSQGQWDSFSRSLWYLTL